MTYEANNISLSVSGRSILKEISLCITPGKFTAVVGPNGAGKSSFVKIMSNEIAHYAGDVRVNGKNISSYRPKELSRIRSVMTQHPQVQFAFNVREIISFGRHAHDTTSGHNASVIEEVVDATNLHAFVDRNYLTLSGGEKQRVQLARTLAQVWEETLYPRYILLDEPTSSMDIAQQQQMFGIIRGICSRNIGVLAIVHDLNLAAQFSDEICMINNGRIQNVGSVEEVFTKENIEETFCCKVNIYRDPCTNCPFVVPTNENVLYNMSITK
ncbi:heme ABC transporter ATP-binding protein [Pseudochryseolinea flava]|uniref:heme ABC transporter ATP-binding protein n=1 Tax=Pseudochryseolinea flava TaxID=2059302 RepID=UPI0014034B7B|nr:heme ABC transporter ATP-binding protein [Pseudochryseolinea flava]